MGATASISGTALNSVGGIAGGIAKRRALDAAAGQLNEEATQSVAAGIQANQQARRQANYVLSNAQARIAGGGLTTTGTSAVRTQGEIAAQGEYNARTAIYQGEDRAAELNYRASTLRNEGTAAQTSGILQGVSSAIKGGQSFYDKYGSSFSPSSYFTPRIDPGTTDASDYGGALA